MTKDIMFNYDILDKAINDAIAIDKLPTPWEEQPSFLYKLDGYEYYSESLGSRKIFRIKERPEYWDSLRDELQNKGIKVDYFAWGKIEYKGQ